MPIKNCVFSSGRHICEILSVGVPFFGVQHAKPAVTLLLQYQSSPIQQPNAKYLFGLVICCLFLNQFSCGVQIRVIIFWKRVGSSAAMLAFWHILLYPFLTVIDGFIYIYAWADCTCCYTIVHFHWFDLGSKINIWVPY